MINNKSIRLSEFKNYFPEENIYFMKLKMSQDKISTYAYNFIMAILIRYRTRKLNTLTNNYLTQFYFNIFSLYPYINICP